MTVADANLSTPTPTRPPLLAPSRPANHCNHWRHLCFVKPFFLGVLALCFSFAHFVMSLISLTVFPTP